MDLTRTRSFQSVAYTAHLNGPDRPLGTSGIPAQSLSVYVDTYKPGPRWVMELQLQRLVRNILEEMDAEVVWDPEARIAPQADLEQQIQERRRE